MLLLQLFLISMKYTECWTLLDICNISAYINIHLGLAKYLYVNDILMINRDNGNKTQVIYSDTLNFTVILSHSLLGTPL